MVGVDNQSFYAAVVTGVDVALSFWEYSLTANDL